MPDKPAQLDLRGRLADVVSAKEHLSTQRKLFDESATRLEESKAKLLAEIIKAEGLLCHADWQFSCNDGRLPFLTATKDWHDFPGLCELLSPDYHEQYGLWDEPGGEDPKYGHIVLRFDDGEITLQFKDFETLGQFVEEYQITVTVDDLIAECNRLAQAVDRLTKLQTTLESLGVVKQKGGPCDES